MSSYTQPRRGMEPEDFTNMECIAPLCTTHVQEQFHSRHVYMCQEHALSVWATVQEMVDPEALRRVAKMQVLDTENRLPEDWEPVPISEAVGWVYFIRVGELIKIGFTTDLANRMRAYPPDATLLAHYQGRYADEQRWHQLLAEHRADRREWYHQTAGVMDAVEEGRQREAQDPRLTPEQQEQSTRFRDAFSPRWHRIPPVIR